MTAEVIDLATARTRRFDPYQHPEDLITADALRQPRRTYNPLRGPTCGRVASALARVRELVDDDQDQVWLDGERLDPRALPETVSMAAVGAFPLVVGVYVAQPERVNEVGDALGLVLLSAEAGYRAGSVGPVRFAVSTVNRAPAQRS